MTTGTLAYFRAIADLSEECSCGSKTGLLERGGIEAPGGELLAEVSCKGCRKLSLIPDRSSEERRRICERGELPAEYRPTWRLNPATGEIVSAHPYSEKKSRNGDNE